MVSLTPKIISAGQYHEINDGIDRLNLEKYYEKINTKVRGIMKDKMVVKLVSNKGPKC